jgi:predicted aldo/keto reductase-like oxidoreductase
MRTITLGKTGLKVSAVGFGGIPIQRVSDDDAVRAIHAALDAGVTFIDTAAGYSDSQRKIGKAIAGRRHDLVLATKSGQRSKDAMLTDVQTALGDLGTDYIDLYQFHGTGSMDAWDQIRAPGGALEGLLEAKEKGYIRHIGLTSHSLDFAVQVVDDPAIETMQFPFNFVTSEPREQLIPKCRDRHIGFIAMKPMCGGMYRDAELAFKFLNDFPDVVAIPGIEKPEEILQIARVVESGATLDGEDRARAEAIVADLGKRFCRRCGYCQPCPHGVPIQSAMVWESFVARMSPETIATGFAPGIAEGGAKCTECGECESKCPYELPIIETVKRSTEAAKKAMASA